MTECNGVKPNLTFGNSYTSTKLLSILTALDIPAVCTARVDRLETAPTLSTKVMMKKERGEFCYSFDKVRGLYFIRWIDNSIITTLSNCLRPYPQDKVERFSRKQNKKIQVQRPKNIKIFNDTMGGVYLLDDAVATCRINIKGEKWWWPHFTNCLGILMAGAWKVYQIKNSENNERNLLEFAKSVVQSYLHIYFARLNVPQYWKTKILVDSSKRLTGRNHFPNVRENQRRCAIAGGKSGSGYTVKNVMLLFV